MNVCNEECCRHFRCPCEVHREMYSAVGQWYCTRHSRINYQPIGEDVPDPKVVRKAQRKAVQKALSDQFEPSLPLEIGVWLCFAAVVVMLVVFGQWFFR